MLRYQTVWSLTVSGSVDWSYWLTWLNFDKCRVKISGLDRKKKGLINITFNTRGQSPCCPRHLSWETGALDCLRAFFNLVLVAATMGSNYFTSPCPLLLWPWRRKFRRKGETFFSSFVFMHLNKCSLRNFQSLQMAELRVQLQCFCGFVRCYI